MNRRPSPQTKRVLAAFVADPEAWRHGYDLGDEVGVGAGSLYPILIRLHERECLESRWESPAPQGRPPRHEYRLTATGAALAREWTNEDRQPILMRPAEA
jgi:DNA-binding PadR family transcriptional regulator